MKGCPVPTAEAQQKKSRKPRVKGTRNGALTREHILEEATRLIAERGFRNTTMKAVAEAVGITEPAVYRHFPGKEQLLVAVFTETAYRSLRIDPKDLSKPAIDVITRQIVLLTRPEQVTLRRLIAEMYAAAAIEPELASLVEDFVQQACDRLLDQLAQATEEGDASPGLNRAHLRSFIHIFMAGLAHHETLAKNLVGDDAWADFIADRLRKLVQD